MTRRDVIVTGAAVSALGLSLVTVALLFVASLFLASALDGHNPSDNYLMTALVGGAALVSGYCSFSIWRDIFEGV